MSNQLHQKIKEKKWWGIQPFKLPILVLTALQNPIQLQLILQLTLQALISLNMCSPPSQAPEHKQGKYHNEVDQQRNQSEPEIENNELPLSALSNSIFSIILLLLYVCFTTTQGQF